MISRRDPALQGGVLMISQRDPALQGGVLMIPDSLLEEQYH